MWCFGYVRTVAWCYRNAYNAFPTAGSKHSLCQAVINTDTDRYLYLCTFTVKDRKWIVGKRIWISAKGVRFYAVAAIALLLLFTATFYTIRYWPNIISLFSEENRDMMVNYIRDKGAVGVLIFIGLQVLQVVVSFIPGEVTEITGGMVYGALLGYLFCAIGVLIGSILMYYTVKYFGRNMVTKVLASEKLSKYKFLHDEDKIELVVFILFFIPGTPKDLFTWLGPFIPLSAFKFFAISTIARIPSIISSTFAGASFQRGNIWMSVVVFVVIGITGIIGILYNKKFIEKRNKKHEQKLAKKLEKRRGGNHTKKDDKSE